MRDCDKILRYAVAQALNGTVDVGGVIPVFDEAKSVSSTATKYILLSTQTQLNNNTQDSFMTDCTLDVEVCVRTGASVSKDTLDDIANAVLTILFPTPISDGIASPSMAQITNFQFERSITRTVEITSTESLVRKIITVKASIVQQF
jgi:hypothetical protein